MADDKDFNDILENIFLSENTQCKESYNEGYRTGCDAGNPEGFHLGYHKGAEIGRELDKLLMLYIAQRPRERIMLRAFLMDKFVMKNRPQENQGYRQPSMFVN